MKNSLLFIMLSTGICATAYANKADVINVSATQSNDKSWRFDVTVKHDDEGWEHYANEWIVVSPDNKILAKRTLYHPHVHEQPFTRNIQGVMIPGDIETVRVIAQDTQHHGAGKIITYDLKKKEIVTKENHSNCKDSDKCQQHNSNIAQ